LNMSPLNSVVTSRSISDNPDLAIKLLTKQIEAMQQLGIAATIKHFPGDGVDYRDQHMITTENTLPMDKWWQLHGKVFKALIDAGASSVMLGHIRLTNFQKEKINGFTPPATLSKELIDLLKVTMGFNGVVVSDALDMGGIQQYYPTRISTQVACFAAGCDVLLWPEEGYMDTLEAKILNNEIPMSRLDDAVSRIWALKEKLGMLDKNYQTFIPISDTEKQINKQTATTIAENSITKVWDNASILPIKQGKNKRVLFHIVSPATNQAGIIKNFQTSIDGLKEKGFDVDTALSTPYFDPRSQETEKYDYMIFAFYRFPFNPFSSKMLEGNEAFKVWLISTLPPQKVITISYGDPYIHHRYFERVGASINAYGTDKETQKAVIKALTGEIPFSGNSPIHLFDPH
jgi:beta-N-acetylhexosaminidase